MVSCCPCERLHRPPASPGAGGLKRGFFGSPSPSKPTPTATPREGATVAAAAAAGTTPGSANTASTFNPAAALGLRPVSVPASPGRPSVLVQGQQQPQQQVVVSDVRAPSVPRSPRDLSSYPTSSYPSSFPGSGASSGPMSPRDSAGVAAALATQQAAAHAAAARQQQVVAEHISNLQTAWELVRDPGHRLSGRDAEGAWERACAAATAAGGPPVGGVMCMVACTVMQVFCLSRLWLCTDTACCRARPGQLTTRK